MKKAQGFITDDGRFFESHTEAEYHEARRVLTTYLDVIETGEGRYVDPDKFIMVLLNVIPGVERFINAYKADPESADRYEDTVAEEQYVLDRLKQAVPNPSEHHIQGNGKEVSPSRPYRGSRESPPGVLEQSFGRPEPVPNVGRGPQSEKLQDDS